MFDTMQKKNLLKNTIMLYILTFSNYILSFIIVPYETRVLGPEKYGLLGLSTAIIVYFQLFIDFGFILSATEEVANNSNNKKKLSTIFTSVTLNKLFLSALSFLLILGGCFLIPRWKDNLLLIALFCLSAFFSSLMPDYLYRGLEQMSAITIRTVLIRLFFTLMVLAFVKEADDYILIPLLQLVGNAVALFSVYLHLNTKYRIHFVKCPSSDLFGRMRVSFPFFVSRIATTMYSAANTIILDSLSAGAMTAYYTSADKIVSTAKSGLSPISDSLYPYMIKNKDFKLVRKVLLFVEPIIIVGCVVLFLWAKPLCIWFFGEEYADTALALRALIPIIAIILPSYIFGFPVLGAMGLSKYANYSVILASSVHVIVLMVLFVSGRMNIVTLGVATTCTELLVLIYRLVIVFKHRARFS